MNLNIEVLSKNHNRSAFDCGDNELNYFLQKIARQHITKGISKTFVLVDIDNNPTEIIAFMTLVVCEISSHEISHSWKNKYPERIPAAKLARLAVSAAKSVSLIREREADTFSTIFERFDIVAVNRF